MKDIIFPITYKTDTKGLKDAETGLSRLGNFAEKAGKAMAAGLAVAAAAAVAFGIESIKAAAEAEAITRGLENAAKNAGIFGDKAANIAKATKALDEHSKSLGELTGIDDEIINQIKTGWLAVPSLAALGTKGLNNLAEVVADTAAGTGKDITAIGLAFQRVAGDTENAFSKLTRAGIVFTDEQKATFDSLLATNGEMAAQQYLIEQLGIKYEGAAAAAANPFERLQVIFGNLKEAIGAELLPAFEQVVPMFQKFAENLLSSPEFQAFLSEISTTLVNMLPQLETVVTNFNKLLLEILPGLNPAMQILGDTANIVAIALGKVSVEGGNAWRDLENLSIVVGAISGFFEDFDKWLKETEKTLGGWGTFFKAVIDGVVRAINPLGDLLNRTAALIQYISGNRIAAAKMLGITIPTGADERRTPIPRQAEGGITVRSGLSWVGEEGPELLNLPRGAQVIPLDRMASGGGNVTNISFTVNAGMGTDGAALGEQIVTAIRKYERTSGQVFARA